MTFALDLASSDRSGLAPERAIGRLAASVPESGIVEIFNYGRNKEGLVPLWVGEGDLPTPAFITEAATRSLAAGETYYTHQRGIPDLRAALAAYHARLFGRPFDHERFYVTIGGMHGIEIAMRMVADPGDEVIVPTPAWPNFDGAIRLAGARTVEVPMTIEHGGWTPDFERIAAAITPKTRAIVLNSPSNPTGWVASRDDLVGVLELARRHGLWIIADEVYQRFVYGSEPRSVSFHDVATDDDRILYVNTFSKNWAMTGWRVGWIEAPAALGPVIENLVQYTTSGVATFLQRGAIAALERGEEFVAHQIARARKGREILTSAFAGDNRIRFTDPAGAFYLFLQIEGYPDATRLAYELIDKANVGLAPGTAFGSGAGGFLRLCYARSEPQVRAAAERIVGFLKS